MLYEQTTLYNKFIFKVVILVSFSLKKIISSFWKSELFHNILYHQIKTIDLPFKLTKQLQM